MQSKRRDDTTAPLQNDTVKNTNTSCTQNRCRCRLLVLHGNRQTGSLLLGRMDKLRKRLAKQFQMELIAIDAPFVVVALHSPSTAATDPPNHDNHQDDYEGEQRAASSQQLLRTWWHRYPHENTYEGLEESIQSVRETWMGPPHPEKQQPVGSSPNQIPYVGLLGFSQGARLAHLLAVLHQRYSMQNRKDDFLPGLQFVMLVAGYDTPIPNNLMMFENNTYFLQKEEKITIPSLHVWGRSDRLILPEQSESLVRNHYDSTTTVVHVHEGGHHVPMRAENIRAYLDFIQTHMTTSPQTSSSSSFTPPHTSVSSSSSSSIAISTNTTTPKSISVIATSRTKTITDNGFVPLPMEEPDAETALQQQEEVEALQAIFPEEIRLLSRVTHHNEDATVQYEHPIAYEIDLKPSSEADDDKTDMIGIWPPHPIRLRVKYPPRYPSSAADHEQQQQLPIFQLIHDNDGLQFTSSQVHACMHMIHTAAQQENGNPCVLSCLYAAREYFESGAMKTTTTTYTTSGDEGVVSGFENDTEEETAATTTTTITTIPSASADRIRTCNLQGLRIAERLLQNANEWNKYDEDESSGSSSIGKGGSWLYTIGLVGKPSAGKSTLFNAATGFARQKQRTESKSNSNNNNNESSADSSMALLGGAAVAPHPFTTIDPNVGYCWVPAPKGSCPEEDYNTDLQTHLSIGSTHGRDAFGRRLIPAQLKDVAGLVPGAYQGRGRGNQFLNDLTDADVLIHVLDASGLADSEGNVVVVSNDNSPDQNEILHPKNDMAWIRNELVEWVYSNLLRKWDIVRRKGRTKLTGMFSGYGQPQAMSMSVLQAVEKFMEEEEGRDRALEHLDQWDEGDLHRLVSAFLGVRFPIALAMNKNDLPSSQHHVDEILESLPIHGTHVGTPLSARNEMLFIRRHMEESMNGNSNSPRHSGKKVEKQESSLGTWNCLQSAMSLRKPIMIFPVTDFISYSPLPGLFKYATTDPSLPSRGMIACLQASGGCAPSEWDDTANQYLASKPHSKKTHSGVALRDTILMKPGSTVEDVFLTLKRLGALSGEFVRAEAAGALGVPAKPIPKYQVVSRKNCILKIMTNRRTNWQNS